MKAVLKKVWLRLAIVLLMITLPTVGLLTRCYNTRDVLPKDACYVIQVEKTDSKLSKPVTLTLAYDSQGNLLMHREGNERTTYTYDAQGRMLTNYGHDLALDLPLQMIDYTYDAEGRLTREEGYYMMEDNNAYYCIYDYDDQGNMTCKQYRNGKLFEEWRYSVQGQLVEQIHHKYNRHYQYTYTYFGKLQTESYTYDNGNGLRTETTEYTYSLQQLRKKSCLPWRETTYEYGAGGLLMQKLHVDHWQNREERRNYAYDPSGRLISYVYAWKYNPSKDELVDSYFWQYDQQGRMTQYGRTDPYGNPSTHFTWSYDAAGNVIKCVYNSTVPWVCEFTYTWPEGELPLAVRESAAAYIAAFTLRLETYMPEHYLQDE